ncbi:Hypothetical protein Minf_1851 [Methylacidiphilum infernorum V4]|uniref:Uncharacterized protein n=1 Tax=Methylacidiphilum infernorum (isolate V4) TaxID=481448 RepID=B3DXV3_METI4|nr:Hypothetical protein Minf_1851 [Methylacidiphilum infernorum V4]
MPWFQNYKQLKELEPPLRFNKGAPSKIGLFKKAVHPLPKSIEKNPVKKLAFFMDLSFSKFLLFKSAYLIQQEIE